MEQQEEMVMSTEIVLAQFPFSFDLTIKRRGKSRFYPDPSQESLGRIARLIVRHVKQTFLWTDGKHTSALYKF